jgi:DnaA-homolog protein
MRQMILELAPPPAATLDNFFPGRNGAALAAIRGALQGAERFVYIWSMPGGGKSHLLHAFVHGARALGVRAGYARAPQFDASLPLDALAADDVEQLDIVGQLCAFDAYNGLHALGGAIVAAGDRPPKDLPLREDLRTRIGSGLVLQVHPLSDGEKRAALLEHAAGRGLKLGEDIIAYLLSRHARDMGSLVAIIDALDRYSLQTQRAITIPLLREALRNPA